MHYWAKPPLDPTQSVLFAVTFDQAVPPDHEVRLYEEVLGLMDWSAWEAEYAQGLGRPPIHPRYLAGLILWGLQEGFRSSRHLEWACHNVLPLKWLMRGFTPDHATIAEFRTQFADPLKDLGRQLLAFALRIGWVRLKQTATDGTRIKANSSRHETASAATLAEQAAALERELEEAFRQMEEADRRDAVLWGGKDPSGRLSQELANLMRRREAIQRALKKAQEKDRAKPKAKAKGQSKTSPEEAATAEPQPATAPGQAARPAPAEAGDSEPALTSGPAEACDPKDAAEPARIEPSAEETKLAQAKREQPRGAKVPLADPDADLTPNKEGGYAPNYIPVVTTDEACGFVVAEDVINGSSEENALLPQLDAIEAWCGRMPDHHLADAASATGPNLAGLEERDVEALIPMDAARMAEENPARREEPRTPVPESVWEKLPVNPHTKRLDKAGFVYVRAEDAYYCPQGRKLPFHRAVTRRRRGDAVKVREYRCTSCRDCPLARLCRKDPASPTPRTVLRDEHEPLREAMAAQMRTPEAKARYRKRWWMAETAFGYIKAVMGVRQFLLRGLEKVRTEWRWICTALNLRKLIAGLARLRALAAAAAA